MSLGTDIPFGKYMLVEKLAEGGMGEVFLARMRGDAGFEKTLVIKRLLPQLSRDARFVTMFLDEARIAADLNHPNICQVYELGEAAGSYFIAMEYLEGVPSSMVFRKLRRDNTLCDLGLWIAFAEQACAGLQHAHSFTDQSGVSANIIHRDISPSNLFVTVDGVVKLLDFGISKSRHSTQLTATGVLKGKCAYMSPEQVMSKQLDQRSDVFSLGVVFFELLTNRRLFERASDYETFRAITEESVPDVRSFRPTTPARVAMILSKALAPTPTERFGTVADMAEALELARNETKAGTAHSENLARFVQLSFAETMSERRRLARGSDQLSALTKETEAQALEALNRNLILPAPEQVEPVLNLDLDPIIDSRETRAREPQENPETEPQVFQWMPQIVLAMLALVLALWLMLRS